MSFLGWLCPLELYSFAKKKWMPAFFSPRTFYCSTYLKSGFPLIISLLLSQCYQAHVSHIYLASFPISFDKVLNYNHPTQNTHLFPSHTYNQPFSRWPISAPLLTSWLNYSLLGKSGPITFKLFLTSSPLLYLPALLWECYILPPVFPFPPSTISLLVHVLKMSSIVKNLLWA